MRALLYAVLAVALGVAVLGLRAANMSTHQPVPPDSALELILAARTHGGERTQSIEEMTEALTLVCRLEVNADPGGPLEPLGDGRFRVVLHPTLDRSDQRQLRGCLEDWRVDGVQVDVETMREP